MGIGCSQMLWSPKVPCGSEPARDGVSSDTNEIKAERYVTLIAFSLSSDRSTSINPNSLIR
jgi:hypothetical protein